MTKHERMATGGARFGKPVKRTKGRPGEERREVADIKVLTARLASKAKSNLVRGWADLMLSQADGEP